MYDPTRLRALQSLFLFQHQPYQDSPPLLVRRGHEAIELILSGQGHLEQDGAWVPVGPGDLLWHQEGERTISRPAPDDPYRCLALRVRVDPGTPRPAPRWTRCTDLGRAAAIANDAIQRWSDPATDRVLLLHDLYSTLTSLALAATSTRDAGLPAALIRLRARIEAEYHRPLSIEHLARHAGVRPQRLHELCRSHLDTTPRRLLETRRLQAVRWLLISTDQPLDSIARACGYNSASAPMALR
jgi:AraC-like DNA-binding protein